MTWGQRLDTVMQEKGMSTAALARQSGVPYNNLAKYLSGKVENPRGDVIARLAETLGISQYWLRDGITPGEISNVARDLGEAHAIDFEILQLAVTGTLNTMKNSRSIVINEAIEPDQIAASIGDNYMELFKRLRS